MVGSGTELKIIREEAGEGTGDSLYQTEDGRWWERWDGIVKTNEEVRTKINGILI